MQSQSNHRHDEQVPKSSSDEEAEDVNDDLGTGRSYECVFCKRGFTTAQALGGHMNIHRKERANKPRPTSAPTSIASKAADEHVSDLLRSYRSLQSYTGPHFATAPDVDVNYRTFIPAPMWAVGEAHGDHDELYARNYPVRHHQNLFAAEDYCRNWRSGSDLSLGIGPSAQDDDEDHVGHDHHKKEIEQTNGACSSEGDGLDLELRLGHDP